MPTRRKRCAEETSLSKAIQQVLTAKGARVIRVQTGILPVLKGGKTAYVHCAPTGTPDLVCVRPATSATPVARTTWIEVKKKSGKRSKEQLQWAQWAELNGVGYACVSSITEAIEAVFFPERARAG